MFIIEGNIGSGKSTLLSSLQKKGFHTLQEPVDSWTNFKDSSEKSLFSNFYDDPKQYCFSFQMYVLLTRLQNMLKANTNSICERSIFTDVFIFAKCLYDTKLLNDFEYSIIKQWYDQILNTNNFKIQGIIYLQVDPNICFQRIYERKRDSEDNIDIDYLTIIHENHERWLNNTKENVIIVNDNDETAINKIIEFIQNNNEI